MVQQQASKGMEEYIPFDKDKCKGGRIEFVELGVDEGEDLMVEFLTDTPLSKEELRLV